MTEDTFLVARQLPDDTPAAWMRSVAERFLLDVEDSPWLAAMLNPGWMALPPPPYSDALWSGIAAKMDPQAVAELHRAKLDVVIGGDAGDLSQPRAVIAQRTLQALLVLAAVAVDRLRDARAFCRDMLGLDDLWHRLVPVAARREAIINGPLPIKGRPTDRDNAAFAGAAEARAQRDGISLRRAVLEEAAARGDRRTASAIWTAFCRARRKGGAKH
jgi:hypothetical protein